MKAPDFVEHPALTPLLPHMQSYTLKGLTALKAGGNKFEASVIEIYAAGVLEKVGELDNAVASIRMAMNFILDLGSSVDTTSDVYRYHYENYILRSIGISDRAHRLVGTSLLLDARKYESVGSIKYVQGHVEHEYPEIFYALTAVSNAVRPNKSLRNELIHSTAFSNRKLGLFSAMEAIDLDIPSDIDAKKLMRAYFSEGGTQVAVTLSDIITSIRVLLESLAKTYETAHSATAP